MNNIFIPSGTLEFIGSKERLQRTVARSGGKLLPGQEFQVTLQTRRDRPSGAAFRFRCSYIQTAQGFQIDYRITPTAVTVLRYLLVIVLLTAILIAALMASDTPRISPLIIIILPMLLFGYHSHCKICKQAFHKLFGAATGPRKEH